MYFLVSASLSLGSALLHDIDFWSGLYLSSTGEFIFYVRKWEHDQKTTWTWRWWSYDIKIESIKRGPMELSTLRKIRLTAYRVRVVTDSDIWTPLKTYYHISHSDSESGWQVTVVPERSRKGTVTRLFIFNSLLFSHLHCSMYICYWLVL